MRKLTLAIWSKFSVELLPLILGSLLLPLSSQAFDGPLQPFLEAHCYECHDDVTTKGGLDLYELSTDLADPAALAKWVQIYDRVAKGEMPPPKKARPSATEKRAFAKSLAAPIATAHTTLKGTVLRRLNREEYENTMNDLFGTDLELAKQLPEDARSHEFSNVGESLSISMVQMHSYLDLAGQVLNEAIVSEKEVPKPTIVRANYADGREAERFIGKNWGQAPDGAVVFFKQAGYPTGLLRGSGVEVAGTYRIRVTGYAYQSDKPITFFLGGTTFQAGVEKPTYGYYEFKPGKPQTLEVIAKIPRRFMVQIEPEGISDSENEIQKEGTKNYKGPGLAINYVEIEGPIFEEYPRRGHKLVFEGMDRSEIIPSNPRDRERKYYRPRFQVKSEAPRADAEKALKRIASYAFRRPVQSEELAPYLALFDSQIANESSIEDALRTSVKAVFCSPDFLFLHEKPGTLEDFPLASRLSYFLSRSTPDRELLRAASRKELSASPEALIKQADRLLAGKPMERFLKDFTDAWLDLRDINFTAPDRTLFPEFDSFLKHSMVEESREFFREIIEQNLPVSNLVKSDFAMLNSRLAQHYGVEGVTSPNLKRVKLPGDSPRGGFLSQASVLKVSANGTNTSPVVRGVWVMERILGQTPPPPPPGIPGVEPDIRGAETLRDLLDKHRDSETCKGCHQMIDPPGFALESFNPIGGWRDQFRSLNNKDSRPRTMVKGRYVNYRIGPPVDSSGQLADGSKFAGFNEFRDLLAEDQDALAKSLLSKFLVFATGREMGFSDRPEMNRIVKQAAEKGYGVRDLLNLAIASEIFRTK